MHEGHGVIRRNVSGQPPYKRRRFGRIDAGGPHLAFPSLDLPCVVITAWTKIAEADGIDVDRVQIDQRVGEGEVDRLTFGTLSARKKGVPENPPVQIGHDVERTSDDRSVGTVVNYRGHREA